MELTKEYEIVLEYYTTHTNEEIGKMINEKASSVSARKAHLTRWGYTHSILTLKKDKKVKKSVEVSNHMNKSNEGKTKARFYIHTGVQQSGLFIGNIASLPCDNWLLEKSILSDISNNFKILGVEYDLNIYKNSLRKLIKTPILLNSGVSLIHGSIGDVIFKGTENEYAHLLLDYCGGFSKFYEEIKFAMLNKIIQVNGTISLTFSVRALGKIGIEICKKFNVTKDKNEFAMKYLVDMINTISDAEYCVDTTYSYKDSQPMILFIIKRNK